MFVRFHTPLLALRLFATQYFRQRFIRNHANRSATWLVAERLMLPPPATPC